MTKFVFLAVLAVLAAVLYSIPSQSADKGNRSHGAGATPSGSPAPSAKAMQNSNGQFQDERTFGRERAAQRKSDRAKAVTPPAPPKPDLPK